MVALGLILIMFAAVVLSISTYFVKKADIDCNSNTFWDVLFATGKYQYMVPGVFWIFLIILILVISVIAWR
jgi:hypothetical protein